MKGLKIESKKVYEAISEIAKKENRTPDNMAETILRDYIGDYNG